MRSFRDQDMRAERMLAGFMDACFYEKATARSKGAMTFRRIVDREVQMKGVDVCVETKNGRMLIDEKASIYYSNTMLPTFAFELDSIQEGHAAPVPGWFVNDALLTEYYMLIWPNVKCRQQDGKWVRKEIGSIVRDDFTIVEAMLIGRADIRAELERIGYGAERLLACAQRLRSAHRGASTKQDVQLTDDLKLSFSAQLAERPVNLVIRRELLRRLAKGIYLIAADGYAQIKGEGSIGTQKEKGMGDITDGKNSL